MEDVQNPGSALGEAIGAQMELALNQYLSALVENHLCLLVSKGQVNPQTKKERKLFLYDNFGIAYNIDAVIANEEMKPLILLEYKYIRYTKHNRDKGSWLCTAHNAIRRSYHSIRSSIAILAGSWSGTSKAMMKSNDINIFIIPFDKIVALLKKHDIRFDWGEKEREVAQDSWEKYSALTAAQKRAIAEEMIAEIKPDLETAIAKTLDNSAEREIEKVAIEIHTNFGEVKRFEFPNVEAALDFLEDFSFEEMLNHADSFTLFNKPIMKEE